MEILLLCGPPNMLRDLILSFFKLSLLKKFNNGLKTSTTSENRPKLSMILTLLTIFLNRNTLKVYK